MEVYYKKETYATDFSTFSLCDYFALGLGLDLCQRRQDQFCNCRTNSRPAKRILAPEFKLATPNGQSIALKDDRGKAVLVNLWATWCPPCRAEMPTIEKVYQEYQDQGLVVLGVDATIQDDPTAIAPFVKQYGITFPILLDVNGEASDLYELRSLPTSFFIGRDGVIKEVVVGGPMSEALLRTNIEEIIK